MADEKTLISYVEQSVRDGASRQTVTEKLLAVGWSEEEAQRAYTKALVSLGVPVPERGGASGARVRAGATETALGLFSFILLGIIAVALGALYFQIINLTFPDKLNAGMYTIYAARDAVHYAMAALLIGFPLYVFVMRVLFRRYREEEGKAESGITKWLTYLVLLITAVTVVGDLIAVIYTFLQGELTIRFFLKALTILAVAGAVFGFYFLERKKVQYSQDIPATTFRMFGWVISAVVVIGIMFGFVVAGTPAAERARSFDEQRANDLSQLSGCINGYVSEYRMLPKTLTDLETSTSYSYCANMQDPDTGVSYGYSVIREVEPSARPGTQEGEYELCAVFTEDTTLTGGKDTSYARPIGTDKWYTHTAGRACDREVVPLTDVPVRVMY